VISYSNGLLPAPASVIVSVWGDGISGDTQFKASKNATFTKISDAVNLADNFSILVTQIMGLK
jgi:hypothetical protein